MMFKLQAVSLVHMEDSDMTDVPLLNECVCSPFEGGKIQHDALTS